MFKKSFLWGAASASYQVEGAFDKDGKGPSIWDEYAHIPGMTFKGTNGDVAVDHYHRYKEDIALMAEQGLKSYRFSISWSRIFPDNSGKVNDKGLEFYSNLVNELIVHDIIPFVTLYHWDLPLWLAQEGGWENKETINHFEKYAKTMFDVLGDRVKHWITFNEMIVFVELGYKTALHPPGVKDELRALNVAHNVFLAHAKTVLLYKEQVSNKSIVEGEIGITHVLNPSLAQTDAPSDIKAADIAEGQHFRWYYDPVLKGKYPKETYDMYHRDNGFEVTIQEELDILKRAAKLNDFIGINYYTTAMFAENKEGVGFNGMNTSGKKGSQQENGEVGRWKSVRNNQLEYTDWDWGIHPNGLYIGMSRIRERFGDIKIYITENGLGAVDQLDDNGLVNDQGRIDYVEAHLKACQKAIDDGINLQGYFMWSFTDLLSWLNGYKKQYGFIYIDHDNDLKRIKKASYHWYKKVIETNGEILK